VDGSVESLWQDLIDENHKGLEEWWQRQQRYAVQEAIFELTQPATPLRHIFARDPLKRRAALKALSRNLPGRPLWYFIYSYFLRLGCLDGLHGLRFCLMKAKCQALLALKKRELRGLEGGSACRSQASPGAG